MELCSSSKSLPRRNPRFYFSTTRFREIFPDPLCGGGALHVARPVFCLSFPSVFQCLQPSPFGPCGTSNVIFSPSIFPPSNESCSLSLGPTLPDNLFPS